MKRIAGCGFAIGWIAVASLVIASAGLFSTAASAEEAIAGKPAKGFLSWQQPLTKEELTNARAGEAYANNTLIQAVENHLEAKGKYVSITGGALTFADGALAHNSMTVSIFNTGNNAVLQAGSTFIVNLMP
jgi:hypothetical protein